MSTTPPTGPFDPSGEAERNTPTTPYDPNTPYTPPTPPAPSPDAQPTVAFGPADGAPAPQAPSAPQIPPAAPNGYAPTGYPQQPGYAPAGFPPAAYGAPAPGAPGTPDQRPKTLAWTALILGAVGTLLALVGFVPVPWLGLITVFVSGFVLLAAFVVALVALISKRYGGTALSVTGLVLSVLGGTIGAFALIIAALFTGFSTANVVVNDGLPAPAPTAQVSQDPYDVTETPLTSDEEAFIAEVRPQVNAIMADIDPSLTADIVEQSLPDSALVAIGQGLLVTGESGIDTYVGQMQAGAGDSVSTDQLRTLFEAIYQAAQTHLK